MIDLAPALRAADVRLSDGRILATHEWGPPDGVPVIFCTGAAMSGALGLDAGVVQRLGLRLIGVDRPGLGRSSPDAAKSLDSWARDVAELCEGLALKRPKALGFSQGGPFALALAARGVVSAVAIVAGQDDFSDPPVAARLPAELRAMIVAMRETPEAMAAQMAGTMSAGALFDMVLAGSAEVDRRIYAEPAFARAYRACLEDGFRQGGEGYALDLAATWRPWPFRLEEIRVPVSLWYGALDASPVHSPDFGARLAERLPNAERTVFEDQGGAIAWTRAEAVLTHLGAA